MPRVARANANQHADGRQLRARKPNRFVAKTLTDAGRRLVHFLVWEGGKVTDAAAHLECSRSWVAALLASPPVIQHMNEQLDVRRKGERPRNLHVLTEIRDQKANMSAAVKAVQVIEQIDDQAHRAGAGARDVAPGFVIQVNVNSHAAPAAIEAKPLELQAVAVNERLSEDDGDVLWIDGRGEADDALA